MPKTRSGSEKSMNPISKLYNSLLAEFKKEQTGCASIAILPQSCIGSDAAILLLINDWATFSKLA